MVPEVAELLPHFDSCTNAELKKGDMVSLPKGAETLWYISAPFKEFWVMA
jgi:uncharacterized cupin superfamily protein